MARERNVTRTFKTMVVKCLVANAVTRELNETVVRLPRVYKDEKTIVKELKKAVENETIKFVSIVESTIEEKMFAMSEIDFLKHANEMPVIETNNKKVKEK